MISDMVRRTSAVLWLVLLSTPLVGCGPDRTETPSGRKRVVSCSPAITRILFDMGLGDQIVGVTNLCTLPPRESRPRVGDMRSFRSEAILSVRPDVVLAQTDPAKFRGITDVDSSIRVARLEIESLADIPAAMREIGRLLGREGKAAVAADRFEKSVDEVEQSIRGRPARRVVFVMGTDRPTAAGAGTFVSDMIVAAGGVNAGAEIPGQSIWRPTQIESVIKVRPDVLICQADAGKAAEAKAYWTRWQDIPAAAAGRVHVVGPDWSIPGPHLADLLAELAKMIHHDGDKPD
jgi:iron complex transport system substrate-binding protein